MAFPSASRVAVTFASIATRLRTISESVSKISQSHRNTRAAAALIDHPLSGAPSSAGASGANPERCCGVGEVSNPRHFTSFRGFGTVPFRNVDFSSRLHGWGAPPDVPQVILAGGGQQVRKIFVEVKGNDLERGIRKWRRKCKEENLKALKEREYFKKPSEKRVLALKERDRRIARRSFKTKLNWILSRRQRGF